MNSDNLKILLIPAFVFFFRFSRDIISTMTYMESFAYCILMTITIFSLGYYYRGRRDSLEAKGNRVMFPTNGRNCDHHLKCLMGKNPPCKYKGACNFSHSGPLFEITRLLMSARRRIDIAMYNFSHEKLADLLIDLHKNEGVNVRIITNHKCDDPAHDKIPSMQRAGISVKVNTVIDKDYPTSMHAKYAIIDSRVIIHGSANWSNNGLGKNDEATVFLSDKAIVREFNEHFKHLWSQYSLKPIH